ncbi:hypothetical protein BD293_1767 [Roseinatronobacter monicus]|uniref:Uncharacterized protein n=1 Tax=Roseinatronobacter monicus TaxID=393481 RepID=A0A543KDH9_9RHOB|nr:hypothetical protein BD293_1767 [Roseinatronobacter monicus]
MENGPVLQAFFLRLRYHVTYRAKPTPRHHRHFRRAGSDTPGPPLMRVKTHLNPHETIFIDTQHLGTELSDLIEMGMGCNACA